MLQQYKSIIELNFRKNTSLIQGWLARHKMSQCGEVKILYPNASHFGGHVRLPETLDERLRCVECHSLLIGRDLFKFLVVIEFACHVLKN